MSTYKIEDFFEEKKEEVMLGDPPARYLIKYEVEVAVRTTSEHTAKICAFDLINAASNEGTDACSIVSINNISVEKN